MARAEVIRPYLEKTMRELLGVEELVVWNDGTIPIRAGSAGVYVKLVEPHDRPVVQVSSPLLRGVPSSPGLLEKLNEINANSFQSRVFWLGEDVIVVIDLLAETLDREELQWAVDLISGFADHWDTELRAGFGGEVAFEEAAAPPPEGVPELPPPPSGSAPEPVSNAAAEDDDGDADRSLGYL